MASIIQNVVDMIGYFTDAALAFPTSIILLAVGFVFVAGVLTSVLNVVPIVGAIVGVFVIFYAQICAFKLWGMGFSAATDVGSTPGTGTTVTA